MLLKDKLRELRLNHFMTQESVAEHLGISAQTVSKWERGLLSPDISLLPRIAVLYRCSIDSIFDMESCWSTEHRKEFEEKIHSLHKEKDYEGVYRTWISEIERKPDNYFNYPDIMLLVLQQKMLDDDHIDRMLLLAEHAEKYCLQDDIRNEIHRIMLQICSQSENPRIKEKALYFYQKLPMLRHSREVYARFVVTGDAYMEQLKWNILYTVDLAECAIRQLITPDMPLPEQLDYYKKAAALYETVLDDKYGGFYDVPLLKNYGNIAALLMQLCQEKEASLYIDRIFVVLERHLSEESRQHPSVLVYSTAPHNHTPPEKSCLQFLHRLQNNSKLLKFHDRISAFAKRYEMKFKNSH